MSGLFAVRPAKATGLQRFAVYLAADRALLQRIDADGRLHVDAAPLTRACVSPYLGSEIVNSRALGLDRHRIYQLLRDPDELAKAAPSFNALPVLLGHARAHADDPKTEMVCGATGTAARFADPFIINSIVVWTRDAIRAIEDRTASDLSASYRYTVDMTPGGFQGEPYDGRMTQIIGSHVALVAEGRVPGARVDLAA